MQQNSVLVVIHQCSLLWSFVHVFLVEMRGKKRKKFHSSINLKEEGRTLVCSWLKAPWVPCWWSASPGSWPPTSSASSVDFWHVKVIQVCQSQHGWMQPSRSSGTRHLVVRLRRYWDPSWLLHPHDDFREHGGPKARGMASGNNWIDLIAIFKVGWANNLSSKTKKLLQSPRHDSPVFLVWNFCSRFFQNCNQAREKAFFSWHPWRHNLYPQCQGQGGLDLYAPWSSYAPCSQRKAKTRQKEGMVEGLKRMATPDWLSCDS